ncbi:probable LRR receptor-like serine/threonine-protein kinase At4g29180 isoform X10 [Malus sylvestris]|uniref:probable LRR receptor-like serine/threonine-protein kinase At4g29180 isoform X10 n=1 Tax=Malus sylvestris TaxID=3752 RepID=UPI0021AC9266|nr:probable LRR receptor-like serine/threonine-protein kinase At4g29180 isoform X10 [Malus sylvestris]
MKMSTGFFLLLLLMLCASSVRAQRRIDFISIDCGSPSKLYEDTDTNITYSPDGDYIDTGINQNISSEFMYPKNPNLPLPLSDLRSFPQGNKNCYTLKPEAGNGSLNLIRATFLYGNYDGENKLPEFDLYLGVNFWSTVRFENASDIVTKEILGFAESNTVDICLINKGLGTPFISALEFRPLNGSTYGTEFGTSASLVLIERLDIGQGNGTGRYGDDVYDRIWSRHSSPSWDPVSTSSSITTYENGYRVPLEVIRTAATPQNASEPLDLYWNTTDMNAQFYVFMYFAEVEKLGKNQSRKFNISLNGSPLFGPFTPRYLQADVISNSRVLVGKDHEISLHKTEDSSLPPILNAVEVFQVMQLVESPTYGEDADAIKNVKTTYQIKKIWAGDPCGPRNFSWEGLECNYSISLPRIISLDLSNNNLTGPVPQFLEELKSLTLLNLKGNQLSGSVPNALRERSEAGLLVLSVDTKNLCGSGSCKKKKKIVAPIVASLVAALAVVIVLMLVWKLRRKRESGTEAEPFNKTAIASKKCQFTHEEVLDITKNLQTSIGKGGFGTVYHGCMKDGTQVAVKMLSASSTQGPREFQTEAELLMRIHHRNLASFIGYCDDANNLALIYEYMANGNLKNSLSDAERSSQMTWEMRLRIAIDAAQAMAAKARNPRKTRNPDLVRGVGKFSRSKMYHKRGLWALKAKNGGVFPRHDAKPAAETQPEKPPKFYPADDVKKPLVNKRKPRPTKLRASITPGTVLIVLAGRFKGKRVVFLKQLSSGLLLVTGPFKINGVPLRRVNQSYVIATSTKVDISGLNVENFDDKYFAKEVEKKKKKGEGEFFEAKKEEKNVLPQGKKDDQKSVDASLIKSIEAVPDLKTYLAARFSLKAGMKPHELVF